MTSGTEEPDQETTAALASSTDKTGSDETIDNRKMSLIEHLTELRRRLMYAFAAFVIVFLVCFYFSDTF